MSRDRVYEGLSPQSSMASEPLALLPRRATRCQAKQVDKESLSITTVASNSLTSRLRSMCEAYTVIDRMWSCAGSACFAPLFSLNFSLFGPTSPIVPAAKALVQPHCTPLHSLPPSILVFYSCCAFFIQRVCKKYHARFFQGDAELGGGDWGM